MKTKLLLTVFVGFLLALTLVQALTITTNAASNTITLTTSASSATVNVSSTVLSNFTIGSISGVTITNLSSTNNVNSVLYNFVASGTMPFGTNTSTVNINAVNATNSSDTGTLSFTVKRVNNTNQLCSGSNPGNLALRIGDMNIIKGFGDDEDYWYPLDEVEVEFDLDNDGSYDLRDIEIKVILYDRDTGETIMDEDDMDISDDKFNLDKNDDTTITLKFQVDPEDLEAGNDDYAILISATGEIKSKDSLDGTDSCTSDSENIEIRTDEDFVALDNVDIPQSATCGDTISISGKAWNIGDKDQESVYARVYNKELGLNNVKVQIGNIDSMESESFNFEFKVPNNASQKTHTIEISIYDEDDDLFENKEDDQSVFTYLLKVESCKPATAPVSITAELSDDTPRAIIGSQVVITATLKNPGTSQATYAVGISGNTQWSSLAQIDPTSVNLNAGESKKVNIYLDINKDASEGSKDFTIKVSSNGATSSEQKVSLALENSFSRNALMNNIRENWLVYTIVLVNILLIIAIIAVVVRIVRKSED